jgi:hypothetical protein
MKLIGPGELFLSSDRLIFRVRNNQVISNSWFDLRSVDTLMDRFFIIGFGNLSYCFSFINQSVLKWLAYTRLLIDQYHLERFHVIYQGYI